MKTAICYAKRPTKAPIPFPNAMTRRQILHNILDGLIMAASGAGFAAVVLWILIWF